MEVAIIILLVLNLLLIAGTLFACLMVGSVVVQIMDVLSKLPDELRQPKKRDGQPPDRPWYTYV
jgi:uncharacterized membrane protein YczE